MMGCFDAVSNPKVALSDVSSNIKATDIQNAAMLYETIEHIISLAQMQGLRGLSAEATRRATRRRRRKT